MHIRGHKASAEENINRMFAGILVGLDKLFKLWYARKEVKARTMEVRILNEFKDGRGVVCPAGEIITVTMSHPEFGKGRCYPKDYTGVTLHPEEYEVIIPDKVFDKLLEGS